MAPSCLAVLLLLSISSSIAHGSILQTRVENGDHVVDVGYAKYLGNYTAPYSVAYLGVPYAEPPVGNLRFRGPQELDEDRYGKAHHGVQDARSYPNFCIQGSDGPDNPAGAGTEDCLKVNIYTPVNATERSNLPVMFYIHGGGITGNPASWPFEHWINFSPHVVIVSVYYRPGVMGFLSHPSFADGTQGDSNAGFLDQVMALKWMKKHIHAFGGDPGRVTIIGQSFGGSSVFMHLTGHASVGLFSGAIAQSSARLAMPSPEQQLPMFDWYAEHAGCKRATAAETTKCLRDAPIDVLARADDTRDNFTASHYNIWGPVFDEKIFTDYPTHAIVTGNFAHVPVLVGATSNETLGGSDFNEMLLSAYPSLTQDDLARLAKIYPPSDYASEQDRIYNANGEVVLRLTRENLGKAAVKYSSAYAYRYDQPDVFTNYPAPPGFVGHAAENAMMFRGTETGVNGTTVFHQQTPIMIAFSHELFGYWLSFVRSGNPNTYKLASSPEWPPYSTNKRIVLRQDPNNSTTVSGSYTEEQRVDELYRADVLASLYKDLQA